MRSDIFGERPEKRRRFQNVEIFGAIVGRDSRWREAFRMFSFAARWFHDFWIHECLNTHGRPSRSLGGYGW
jgi:hypothetical protein